MSPSEIRKATLKQLRETRKAMMSARWMLALEKEDNIHRTEAAKDLLRVHHAIQKLENEKLAAIRDKLMENEQDLLEGREKVSRALQDLKRTRVVLATVTEFVTVVSRVVSLLV